MQKRRPVHLNLLRIKLPASGIVSILHRMSGLLLFLAIPLVLLALDRSLASREGFDAMTAGDRGFGWKLALAAVAWGFLHHLLAGFRLLLLDLHKGVHLPHARFSARLVMVASAFCALALTVWLW